MNIPLITDDQLDKICQTILVSDILNYIDKNRSEYEKYLIEEAKGSDDNANIQEGTPKELPSD